MHLYSLGYTERDTARLVAGLIDGEVERRTPENNWRWAAQALDLPREGMAATRAFRHGLQALMLARLFAELVEVAIAVDGGVGYDEPVWEGVQLPDGQVPILHRARLALPAGELASEPVCVSIEPDSGRRHVEVTGPLAVIGRALRTLLDRAADEGADLFTGRSLRVEEGNGRHNGLNATVLPTPETSRDDLILPDRIWAEIDRNVHRLLEQRELLERLGMGLNRGLLLHGPPGTGKTHLTQVLAAETAGAATTLFVSASAMRSQLEDSYQLAETLAPSLLVLEDIDLVVANRGGTKDSTTLVEFLTNLDGAVTAHNGVITIATTNDPRAIDDAARRAGRFDRLIEIPPPPGPGRRRIWQDYLEGLEGRFDPDRLTAATEGATGADIRELVRHTVLAEEDVTTESLLEAAQSAGFPLENSPGHYL